MNYTVFFEKQNHAIHGLDEDNICAEILSNVESVHNATIIVYSDDVIIAPHAHLATALFNGLIGAIDEVIRDSDIFVMEFDSLDEAINEYSTMHKV